VVAVKLDQNLNLIVEKGYNLPLLAKKQLYFKKNKFLLNIGLTPAGKSINSAPIFWRGG
jgi:hypothetical protein